MNKKTISAKPRAASKAPLSPRGKASKNQTAKKPGDANDIAKMLEAILDKKLGEIKKRIDPKIDDNKIEPPQPGFAPDEAIPAYYKKSKDGIRSVVFDREAWECDECEHYEPKKEAVEQNARQAAEIANEINTLDAGKISHVIQFLDTHRWQDKKRGGLFRMMITDLVNFPRLAIMGGPTRTTTLKDMEKVFCPLEIKIGALQLFEEPTSADEEVELDKKARAPFDAILSAASGYLEKAEAQFPQVKEKLHTVRDKLQELADELGVCSGVPGDCKEASDAAKAAISAAREARQAIEDGNRLVMFANELKRRSKSSPRGKDHILADLLKEGYAQAFKQGTTQAAARKQLYRAGLIQDKAKKKR